MDKKTRSQNETEDFEDLFLIKFSLYKTQFNHNLKLTDKIEQ